VSIPVYFLIARSGVDNEVKTMDPKKVAAHFVAFVYYLNRDGRQGTAAEAGRFARQHWPAFLHYADDGLGKLLTKISPGNGRYARTLRPSTSRRKTEPRRRELLSVN
jgi:hypothetical protein